LDYPLVFRYPRIWVWIWIFTRTFFWLDLGFRFGLWVWVPWHYIRSESNPLSPLYSSTSEACSWSLPPLAPPWPPRSLARTDHASRLKICSPVTFLLTRVLTFDGLHEPDGLQMSSTRLIGRKARPETLFGPTTWRSLIVKPKQVGINRTWARPVRASRLS
jgi:hypothetical protein